MKLHIRLLLISVATIQTAQAMEDARDLIQKQMSHQDVFHAFQRGDIDTITAFIKKSQDLQEPIMYLDPEKPVELFKSQTLLELAYLHNIPAAILQLRARGIDINQPNEAGNTPLARAISNTSICTNTLFALITESTINHQNAGKSTPLHIMLYQEEIDARNLDFLCEQGASLELQDAAGNTPVHYAVLKDPTGKVLNIMLRRTRNNSEFAPHFTNMQNAQGATPLHLAIEQYLEAPAGTDYLNSIERLLDLGADLEIENIQGLTPADLYKCLLAQKDQRAEQLDAFLKEYYSSEEPAVRIYSEDAGRGNTPKKPSLLDEIVDFFSPDKTNAPDEREIF